jgi:hypothetical protein
MLIGRVWIPAGFGRFFECFDFASIIPTAPLPTLGRLEQIAWIVDFVCTVSSAGF